MYLRNVLLSEPRHYYHIGVTKIAAVVFSYTSIVAINMLKLSDFAFKFKPG